MHLKKKRKSINRKKEGRKRGGRREEGGGRARERDEKGTKERGREGRNQTFLIRSISKKTIVYTYTMKYYTPVKGISC